jgi:hypothetical protein
MRVDQQLIHGFMMIKVWVLILSRFKMNVLTSLLNKLKHTQFLLERVILLGCIIQNVGLYPN